MVACKGIKDKGIENERYSLDKIPKRLTTAQRDTVAGEMFARLVDSKTTRTPELRAWHSPDSKQSTCSRLVKEVMMYVAH